MDIESAVEILDEEFSKRVLEPIRKELVAAAIRKGVVAKSWGIRQEGANLIITKNGKDFQKPMPMSKISGKLNRSRMAAMFDSVVTKED